MSTTLGEAQIPQEEVLLATAWEYTREALSRFVRTFLSEPFSWYLDKAGDPQVIWGGGQAVKIHTLRMLIEKKEVPEEVCDRFWEAMPEQLYFSPLPALLIADLSLDVPWTKLDTTVHAKIAECFGAEFWGPELSIKIPAWASREQALNSVSYGLRKYNPHSRKRTGWRAASPYVQLTALSAYRIGRHKFKFRKVQEFLSDYRASSQGPREGAPLPIFANQSQWCRATTKADDLIADVTEGDYSFFWGRR